MVDVCRSVSNYYFLNQNLVSRKRERLKTIVLGDTFTVYNSTKN